MSPTHSEEKFKSAQGTLPERLAVWFHRYGVEKKLAYTLILLAMVGGVTTFLALTGDLGFAADPSGIQLLLLMDFILLLGIIALIARRLVSLWIERKRGTTGARLHSRLVGLFTIVALTPTIVVALFAVIFFEFGLQTWFHDKVKTSVGESLAVAEAYLFEHRQSITTDALAASLVISRELNTLIQNPDVFDRFLTTIANERNLTEVVVFDQTGQVQGKAEFSFLLNFSPEIPDFAIQSAISGEIVILSADTEDRVRALVYLGGFDNSFLLVSRVLDPNILRHIDEATEAVDLYSELEGRRSSLLITFALIFTMVSLMLLSGAVWVGLTYANTLSDPLVKLIQAAERVRAGDWSAKAPDLERDDEIHSLARAFNRMTGELHSQKKELISANQQLDERSRFIEAVLGGVSAGVIGVDPRGQITLINRSAADFMEKPDYQLRGRSVIDIFPELSEILDKAIKRPGRTAEQQVPYVPLSVSGELVQDRGQRTLLLRAVVEVDEDSQIIGYVITFDDITELVSAQRKAAWSDIARRIAHEIKNPLTPIQLSAERLKRKYLKEIQSDPETFELCADTIVRHVGDIGRMVNEFSSFARMPAPEMKDNNLSRLLREAVELQKVSQHDIRFDTEIPDEDVSLSCDGEQINRALTNLLLNAAEAIEGKREDAKVNGSAAEELEARISVSLELQKDSLTIAISDTGRGLPQNERHRLTEPYVTTRVKGTGLGLAIVKKIMEDHGGRLVLGDNFDENGKVNGAQARLVFEKQVKA
ncbi:sensor histidine kinase NtrY-like [Kiloniella sp. b19]|uniref:sensor histidine kinase NtrY-like n=1 Tax=Kiloniella sp. GXU_MW_B19 TaxID=3141326 RepID=UPI0031D60875